MPPSCVMRSAMMSAQDSTDRGTLSKSWCGPMKFGVLTFQFACFVCICKSTGSASRRLSSAFYSIRRAFEMSFSDSYIPGASTGLLAFTKL